MEELKSLILKKRPSLSPSSLKAYTSSLKTILKAQKIDDTIDNIKTFLKDVEKATGIIHDRNLNSKKSILSCYLISAEALELGANIISTYRELMTQKSKDSQAITDKNVLNEKQRENWIEWGDVKSLVKKVEAKWKADKSDLNLHQQYVFLSIITQLPPRRSRDYFMLQIEKPSENADKSNYIELSVRGSKKPSSITYNDYKTSKFYSQVKADVNAVLKKVLHDYIDVLKKEKSGYKYLFFNNMGERFDGPKFTIFVNNIFKKKISLNILRHSFISDSLKMGMVLSKIKENARLMSHSPMMALEYNKVDTQKEDIESEEEEE